MPYIDIRFNLEDITDDIVGDDEDDPNSYYDFTSVEFKDSDLPQESRAGLVEMLAQSDKYHIEITADILDELEK